MHDDLTAILHSYTEEAVSKSRKVPHSGKGKSREQVKSERKNSSIDRADKAISSGTSKHDNYTQAHNDLTSASEEELLLALTKKRAERFRLAGAMGRHEGDDTDPTGMVCTLNGGNGTIPCRELME